jgi:hypothetical protein
MTSFRQALHVMAKDLRESRLVLAAFLLITAFASVAAIKPAWVGSWSGSPITLVLLPLCGMITVASFVQSDSPTNANAFWPSRPLDPSAVLAAKVILTVVLILAIPLLGQLGALLARNADAGVVADSMAESAWSYAKWLIVAFVLAAMTRDIKSFLLAIAVIPILVFALMAWSIARARATNMSIGMRAATDDIVTWSAVGVGALGCAALLVYLYRTRDPRPRTWVAGFALLFLVELNPGSAQPRVERNDAAADIARTTFTVNVNSIGGYSVNGIPRYSLLLTPDSVPSLQRLTLVRGTAVLSSRSGGSADEALDQPRAEMPFSVHSLSGVTWLHEQGKQPRSLAVGLIETDRLRSIVDSGIAKVALDGRILIRVPGPADTVELRVGTAVSRRGTMMVMSKWYYGGGEATVGFKVSSVPANFDLGRPVASTDEESEFALVNEKRGEAIVLTSIGGSGSGGYLVVPGTQVSTGEQSFSVRAPPAGSYVEGEPISDEWFRDARLVISHWVPVGSYAIHVENSNPAQPPPPPQRGGQRTTP